ncbi:unnamed protein product [Nesidiocoris tenuis]|uniref:Uncharacterized protein n=1 Tax=Nesidiocoris tenuis TaxID=355587 RepID=A0A6H5GUQ1_9HEMI|nr:unnamed protein product [Nesidiocoris tenuis]
MEPHFLDKLSMNSPDEIAEESACTGLWDGARRILRNRSSKGIGVISQLLEQVCGNCSSEGYTAVERANGCRGLKSIAQIGAFGPNTAKCKNCLLNNLPNAGTPTELCSRTYKNNCWAYSTMNKNAEERSRKSNSATMFRSVQNCSRIFSINQECSRVFNNDQECPQLLRVLKNVQEHHGMFKSVQECSRAFNNAPDGSKIFNSVQECSKSIRECSRAFKNLQERSRAFKNVPRAFENVQEHSRISKNVQEHPRMLRRFEGCSRPLKNIQKRPRMPMNDH